MDRSSMNLSHEDASALSNFRMRKEALANPNLKKSWEELELGFRATQYLRSLGDTYIGQLVQRSNHSKGQLLNSGVDREILHEIGEALCGMGFYIGMGFELKSAENPGVYKRCDEFELSVRTLMGLKNDDIEYVAELVEKDADYVLKNYGRKSLNELKGVVAGLGLEFSMNKTDKALTEEFTHLYRSAGAEVGNMRKVVERMPLPEWAKSKMANALKQARSTPNGP